LEQIQSRLLKSAATAVMTSARVIRPCTNDNKKALQLLKVAIPQRSTHLEAATSKEKKLARDEICRRIQKSGAKNEQESVSSARNLAKLCVYKQMVGKKLQARDTGQSTKPLWGLGAQ